MSTTTPPRWFSFTEDQAATAAAVCEAVVPGSAAAGPAVYLDSLLATWPAEQRTQVLELLDAVDRLRSDGQSWEQVSTQPFFGFLRALAIEAYYSDFRQPGYTGPSAWDAIGFRSAPMAARAVQDWSFLPCYGGQA